MKFSLASLALLVLLASPVHADWQGDLLRDPAEASLQRTLHHSARALDFSAQSEIDVFTPASAAPRRWWPIVLSALLPGLGETVTGHYFRGVPLVGADAAMLGLSASKNSDGDDLTTAFEKFADEHYSEALWTDHLAGTYGNFVNEFFKVGTTPQSVALYVPKEIDRREWYENIGKWEVFFFGWEEYDPNGLGYWPDPDAPIFSTPTREAYVKMRAEANDAYADRDKYLTVSLLLRVFSLLQVAYLEGFIGNRYAMMQPDGSIGAQLGENLAWVAKSDLRGDSYLALKAGF